MAAAELATINYAGAVSVGVGLARRLRAQGHGRIVALSSVAGQRPRRSNFVYGSSKAGFDAFYRGLSDHLHGSGVTVTVVRPGFVRTRMTAGRRDVPLAIDAGEVASATVAGLRSGRTVVWAPRAMRWLSPVLRALPSAVVRRSPW